MQRKVVSSSNISSIGYDSVTSILEIAFHDGSIYRYFGVPSAVYNALMSADSHGSYFAHAIKDVYRYEKIA